MVNIEIGLPNGERKHAQVEKLSQAFFEALNMLLHNRGVPLEIRNDGELTWSLEEESDDPNQVRANLAVYYGQCVKLERRNLH